MNSEIETFVGRHYWLIVLCLLPLLIIIPVNPIVMPSYLGDLVDEKAVFTSVIEKKSCELQTAPRGNEYVVYVDNGDCESYRFVISRDIWQNLNEGDSVEIEISYIDGEMYDVKLYGQSCTNKINTRDNPVTQREKGYK